MSERKREALLRVEAEAREVFGDRASEWMGKPSKLLDGMAPAELASSQEGARVVLIELERARTPLQAAMRKKRP
jgi:uncharacterized protein (DUF2384 family)